MFPRYEWQSLVLPPRFFRWRIRGNPLSWLNEPLLQEHWDLIIATSMVDLATLRGLHPRLAHTPCLLYMHENQFAFPVSSGQNSSADPQMVNLYSALSADCVIFNSGWNRDSFLAGATSFLQKLPDEVPEGLIETLRDKSRVIPVPIEDRLFADRRPLMNRACPHLLWNHRWEYDKGPDRLLKFLQVLDQRSMPFRLSVVGERFRSYPKAFDRIREQFGHCIEHWGFLESREDYDHLLRQADIVISTALHDFQGLSMLEAMASGCVPLAPDRLAYREYVPELCRYDSHEQDAEREAEAAADSLEAMLEKGASACPPEGWRASRLAGDYQFLFQHLIKTGAGKS
ncbi:glycosyl transferase, group 1 [Marinobacter manganoxydans MnI7-9]|jgi:glycosyltransferase involved in cell wall biosynthesis|uniref:tRNA-queuosine alpha-mannosyltransferase n=2 Tax=Marinobacter TaxID=2742 RepID=G6YTA5_9GAMM|nr:glycosyl transferase, group 1 [Marinobacter manganoxydans MnI7-9]